MAKGVLGLVLACGSVPAHASPAPPAPVSAAVPGCATPSLAELPVRDVLGFVVLRASIAGHPVSLLLDTGAETGLITGQAATQLALPLDPSRHSLIEGTGGPGMVRPNVLLPDVRLGALRVTGMSLPVGALPAAPRVEPKVAGLLGADLLAHFDVELDLARGRMALFAPGACTRAADDPAMLPARRMGPRLAVPVRVDGLPLFALPDTGARSVVLSNGAAAALGVSPDILAADPGGLTGGVDLRQVPFHWHKFHILQIGAETIHDPVLTVTLLRDRTAMLLGSDWFARHRVRLSWAGGQIVVLPP